MQPTMHAAALACLSLLAANTLYGAKPTAATTAAISPSQAVYNLMTAISANNLQGVKSAIAQGAPIKGQGNSIPLHAAAQQLNLSIMQFLVNKGADVNQRDNDNDTALFWTVWAVNQTSTVQHKQAAKDIIAFLLQKGAGTSVNVRSQSGQTPFEMATAKGLTDLITLMKPHKK